MADEEKVVESKSGGGLSAIIPLITLVLVVVAVGLSAVSMVTMMGISKKIDATAVEVDNVEMTAGEIPVTEIDTFNFSKQFIFIYSDKDTGVDNNVVVEIAFGIHNTGDKDTAEEVAEVMSSLSNKEVIIRSGLESMMKSKSFEDFQTEESQAALKADILAYIQGRLGTDKIIDVYFNNMLTTSR